MASGWNDAEPLRRPRYCAVWSVELKSFASYFAVHLAQMERGVGGVTSTILR